MADLPVRSILLCLYFFLSGRVHLYIQYVISSFSRGGLAEKETYIWTVIRVDLDVVADDPQHAREVRPAVLARHPRLDASSLLQNRGYATYDVDTGFLFEALLQRTSRVDATEVGLFVYMAKGICELLFDKEGRGCFLPRSNCDIPTEPRGGNTTPWLYEPYRELLVSVSFTSSVMTLDLQCHVLG